MKQFIRLIHIPDYSSIFGFIIHIKKHIPVKKLLVKTHHIKRNSPRFHLDGSMAALMTIADPLKAEAAAVVKRPPGHGYRGGDADRG